jgi:hypothetical protein
LAGRRLLYNAHNSLPAVLHNSPSLENQTVLRQKHC